MVTQIIIGYSFFVLIGIVFVIFVLTMRKRNNVHAVISGLTENPKEQSNKESYSICDFHKMRNYKNGISNFAVFEKGVIFGISLEPLGIHCGDGLLIQKFDDKQRENIKDNKLIEKNDIILLTYKRDKSKIKGLKSRRFIQFLDISLPEKELRESIETNKPTDNGLQIEERVNQNTIDDLLNRIEKEKTKLSLINPDEDAKADKKEAFNYILSITYRNNNTDNQFYAHYSIHSIKKLFGKAIYIILRENIDSSEIMEEFKVKHKNKVA